MFLNPNDSQVLTSSILLNPVWFGDFTAAKNLTRIKTLLEREAQVEIPVSHFLPFH